jgi:hypothetical protein
MTRAAAAMHIVSLKTQGIHTKEIRTGEDRIRRTSQQDPPITMKIAYIRGKYGPDLGIFYKYGRNLVNLKTLFIAHELCLGA